MYSKTAEVLTLINHLEKEEDYGKRFGKKIGQYA